MLWVIVVALVEIVGVLSAVHAVMQVRTSQGAIAWAVSLVAMPYVAVPLYWVLGRNKFHGMAEAHNERASEIEGRLNRNRKALESFARTDELGPSERSLESLIQMPILGGNALELLIDGRATFDDIVAGIDAAERYVLVQFYIFRADKLGRRMGAALAARAQAGLTCCLLYDEIGSHSLSAHYLDELRTAGVRVSKFNTTRGRENRFQLNFRNHRKIVVTDGTKAWVGGHNVGDEYLGENPKVGPWRDTHVRIEGPAALEAQSSFFADWYWATRDILDLPLPEIVAQAQDARVLIAPTSPSTKLETASLISVELLHVARERVWIATPYFIPDRAVMAALRGAALRGVDVRVMITERADSLATHLAAYWYLQQLGGVGIRFYRYTAGFMHQKVVLVDRHVCSIGTVNWDSRSFRLNFEVSALVHDEVLAGQVADMLEADFARCREVGSTELEERGFFFRLSVKAARLMSPVL